MNEYGTLTYFVVFSYCSCKLNDTLFNVINPTIRQ